MGIVTDFQAFRSDEIVLLPSHQVSATKAKPSYGHVEIRRREVEFADFARHVVERIVSSNPRWNPNLLAEIATESIIPGSILAELEFEEYVAGFAIRSVNRQLPVVVTAETPKLSAVVAAQTEGWQIARYTDVDTLYDVFLSPASSYGPAIPLELELPGIRRLPENQHLFSRGVLKADVLMQENRRT
ncbi:MAG: hypothetical protein Q8K93_05770 [Reyranella sp.]|nr:hypothetical protein [Reyranella sp.]